MSGTEGSGGSCGAVTVDEAMDVAVTAPPENVIVTPDDTITLLPDTDAHTLVPSDIQNSQATEIHCGDMEVSTTTTQLQNISVTPSDPCKAVPSTEGVTQPGGDCIMSKPEELHQEIVCKAEEDSEDSDRWDRHITLAIWIRYQLAT